MSDHPQTGPDLRLWGGVLIATVVLALGVWFMRHEPLPAVSGGVQDATDKAQPNPSATSKAGKGSATTPTLKGAVLDVESRAGIPDAEVICSHGGTTQTVRADASGRFVVDLPPDGRIWAVTATAPGFALEGDPFTVRAEPGATVQVLLAQRGTIAGAVFHLGKPMEGAEVRLLKLSGVGGGDPEVDASVVRTDRAGQFVVEAFPGRVRVLATSEGFATAESREIQVCGGARVEGIVLDLTPRGSVVALVRSEEGTPVSQARVEVMGVATWQVPSPLTDTEGRAELKDVPAGESRLRVTALGYSIVETTPLTIVPDETLEHTIVLPALQGISGRVVDPNGQPVRGASVVLKPASEPTSSNRVHTGHAGQFRFDGLDVGAYLLSATHPRYGPATEIRSESGGQEPVVLTLSEGGAISGHVLDASRQPAPAFTVVVERFVPDTVRDALEPVKLGPAHFGAQPFDSAEGVFQLDGLGPGVYDLYVDGGDLGSGQAEGIVVQAGRTTSRVTVELEGGSVVTGQVVDAQSGAPIADAEVALADGHRRRRTLEPRTVRTTSDGRFAFRGVASGRRSLRVRKEGYTTRIRAGLELGRGDSREVEIALMPRLEGKPGQVEFFGIGAVLQMTPEGTVRIQNTLEGGPGSQFGLKAGDTILRVDGEDVTSLGLGKTVELIRGEEGAAVTLEIQREGEPYPFEVGIDRGRVVFEEKDDGSKQ